MFPLATHPLPVAIVCPVLVHKHLPAPLVPSTSDASSLIASSRTSLHRKRSALEWTHPNQVCIWSACWCAGQSNSSPWFNWPNVICQQSWTRKSTSHCGFPSTTISGHIRLRTFCFIFLWVLVLCIPATTSGSGVPASLAVRVSWKFVKQILLANKPGVWMKFTSCAKVNPLDRLSLFGVI